MLDPGEITFGGGGSPSIDALAGGMPAQVNVVSDAAGALRLRPGISTWNMFPAAIPDASPVVAMKAWNGYLIYVTLDRKLWALAGTGLVIALSDATAATQLDGGLRPSIATTRTRVIIAGGGAPQKWEGLGLSSRLGGSPPNFSHVTTIAQRVVGNDSGISGILYWSGIGDTGAETWLTGLNFAEAEVKQDPVIGLYSNSNELVALGTETVQMLSPDPSIVFSKSRTFDFGWGPPHSYIQLSEQFMGLDALSRVIITNGRSFRIISAPSIGQQLDSALTTSDCWGMRYKFGNYDLGILNFPTDGRSFVFDTAGGSAAQGGGWTEWHGYNAATSSLAPLGITSSYYWADQKATLVGLATGQIAMLDQAATTDLGSPIVAQMTSTFEGHNSNRLKRCAHVYLKFNRGGDSVGGTNTLLYSYRDDLGPFCEPFQIPIGDPSDAAPVVTLDSLGTYRMRQHRIIVNSTAFRFSQMTEDYVTLSL